MKVEIPHEALSRLSAFVARTTGLCFPQERWPELLRGIAAAADDLGFAGDLDRCTRWLAGAPLISKRQIESLATHLTVGETYFFRERRHFDFLAERILPELINRNGERRLRIWSAGCCTGEEAYSIAIVLRRVIPDLERWQVTLLATDINPRFLRKAETGVFGQWSFRDAPDWLKTQYFRVRPDGQFEVLADIKRMVRFVPLNLAEDAYPSLSNDTHAMDVVFCRNVLMYFEQAQARRVVEKVHRAQREGGWLFVGSTELFHLSASPYATVSAPGVVVYRKNPVSSIQPSQPADPRKSPAPEVPQETPSELIEADPVNVEMPADPREDAAALYAQGRYKEAADILGAWLSNLPPERANAAALSLLARCLANQGELVAALRCCDQSIAADKCSAASQYLRALILQEQGVVDEAIRSLRNALYLDPDFVLAHMTLGTLARDRGQTHIAQKHLKQALKMVQGLQPGTILPESEGMTAGQLTNMIHSLIHEEVVP